ncbi:histidine kinase, partial [Streptomyces botrytidirepellens]
AGSAPSGGAPSGPNLFEAPGRSAQRNEPPAGPGSGAGAPSDRPSLPTRGDQGPTVAPPTGAPGRADSGDQGNRPQLPSRDPARELPGPQQAPGTSWGASPQDDWAGPAGRRDAGDRPRGHEEPETTGQFARPDLGSAPGERRDPFGNRGPGDTGELPQLSDGPNLFEPRRGPGDTGEFPRPDYGRGPGDTGEFQRPDVGRGPGDTGEFAVPGQEGRGPGDTAQFNRPDYGRGPGDTGEFARPELGQGPGDTGEFPQVRDDRNERGGRQTDDALPPAGPGDGRTPIFDTIESTWLHPQADPSGGQGDGGRHP